MSGTGRIADLVRKLDAMRTPAFREGVARQLGEEAQRLYRSGFNKGQDPYGEQWAPSFNVVSERANRNKRYRTKTLVNTGYLRASGEVDSVTSNGFTFKVYAPYGQFHQTGTRFMPQRMIVPSASRGLGTWGAPFNRIAARAIRELMR